MATSSPPEAAIAGGALARLDPTASPEISAEYPLEPSMSVPFGVAFADSRRRAFFAGCGAGASAATALVGAVVLVAWLSGPRAESARAAAPMVNVGSKEPTSPALAASIATVDNRSAAQVAPARAEQAPPPVVAAPVLVEDAAEPRSVAETEEVEAQDERSERQPVAEADAVEAPGEAQAPTAVEPGPARVENAPATTETAAPTEAPAPPDQASDEPRQIALAPAAESEQARASDDAPRTPGDEQSTQ